MFPIIPFQLYPSISLFFLSCITFYLGSHLSYAGFIHIEDISFLVLRYWGPFIVLGLHSATWNITAIYFNIDQMKLRCFSFRWESSAWFLVQDIALGVSRFVTYPRRPASLTKDIDFVAEFTCTMLKRRRFPSRRVKVCSIQFHEA